MAFVRPDNSAHWYTPEGKPRHTRDNGKPTTLKDARVEGLLPSVTSILNVISKPALESWKVEQGILSALRLDRLESESMDSFAKRIVADMKVATSVAATFGTKVHHVLEQYNIDGSIPDEDDEVYLWFVEYKPWFDENITKVHQAERVLVNEQHGYAGTVDLVADHVTWGRCVIDFKTQGVKRSPRFYETWIYQLSAYQQCIEGDPKCVSLIIDSKAPSPPVEKLWGADEVEDGWEVFKHANQLYQKTKKYTPPLKEVF